MRFGDKKDEFIRDRIVCGIYPETERKFMLRESDLILDKAKEIFLMHELADSDNKYINIDPDVHRRSERRETKAQISKRKFSKCKAKKSKAIVH